MKRSLIWIPFVILLTSCKSLSFKSDAAAGEQDRKKVKAELTSEQSKRAHLEQLAELRKEIPVDKQKQSDELSLQIQMMNQASEQPHLVRERFAIMVDKKRTAFNQKIKKLRDNYRAEETKRREEYLRKQKAKRDAFIGSKREFKESRQFFADQEKDRLRFVSDERDRRQSFESEIVAQSKDFDSYIREKQNQFNEQFRLYSKKYSERPKETKAVTGDENEFRKLKEMPAIPLGTED